MHQNCSVHKLSSILEIFIMITKLKLTIASLIYIHVRSILTLSDFQNLVPEFYLIIYAELFVIPKFLFLAMLLHLQVALL